MPMVARRICDGIAYLGDWLKHLSVRHPRAEQGAQRRSADPRIHAAISTRCHGAEFCSANAPRRRSRNGSSGLRDAAARLLRPWMTKLRGLLPISKAGSWTASLPCYITC